MTRAERIKQKLTDAFQPEVLEVIDESESHRGHGGYQEGGESHFRVVITAPALGKLSRVARHRAIHTALGSDLIGEIHALSLDVSG